MQKKRRLPLSREAVVSAAVELADTRGLETVSMRELGRALGVEAMSLYNHVRDKDDLLDAMMDHVVAGIELPGTGSDWKKSMRARAVSALKVFRGHPWAAALLDTRTTGGAGRLRYFESVIRVLRQAGFTLAQASAAFSLLDAYIYGFCRKTVTADTAKSGSPEAAGAFLEALPAEEFPHLAELARLQAAGKGHDEDKDFAFGLGLILDGLERLLPKG